MKTNFKFKKSYYDAINELDAVNQNIMLKAILEYGLNGIEIDLKSCALRAVFSLIKADIDKSNRSGAPKGNNNAKKANVDNSQNSIKNNEKQPDNVDNSIKTIKNNSNSIDFNKNNQKQSVIHSKKQKQSVIHKKEKARQKEKILSVNNYNNKYINAHIRTRESLISQLKENENTSNESLENSVDLCLQGRHQAKCYKVLDALCYVANLNKPITLNSVIVTPERFNSLLDKLTIDDVAKLVNMLMLKKDKQIDNLQMYIASIYSTRKQYAVENNKISI